MNKILIVDDEADLRSLLTRLLSKNGFQCVEASSGKKALEVLQQQSIDLVLCDFKLRDINGGEILQYIRETDASIPVIIMTGYSHIKTAIEVMKLGATDFLIKPLIPAELLFLINKTLNVREAKGKTTEEQGQLASRRESESYIFSNSDPVKNILRHIDLVAPTNFCVILYGESGSGKEAFAQEIHKRSNRRNKPFLAIDCGVLSKELATSTLFGHERGAFTGAVNQKPGSFELAAGGTVFLDEVSNLSYDVQTSLLRVVQEKRMRRVGGTKDIKIDVRIIVASNRPLWSASLTGEFREDLYHRFNEFIIEVPPLRERKDDVLFYTYHFLNAVNRELGKNIQGLETEVIEIFMNYPWPGNLRELRNVVRRAALLTESEFLNIVDLPVELINPEQPCNPDEAAEIISANTGQPEASQLFSRRLQGNSGRRIPVNSGNP
jgi:two-component system response regulator HydG